MKCQIKLHFIFKLWLLYLEILQSEFCSLKIGFKIIFDKPPDDYECILCNLTLTLTFSQTTVGRPLLFFHYLFQPWLKTPMMPLHQRSILNVFSTLITSFQHHGSSPDRLSSPQAGSHIQTLMGSQSLQHRSREQQPYEGNINKVTIQQFQSPLPIQIPSSQATRGPQPGRCLIQTKGQRSMDGYPEQVRRVFTSDEFSRYAQESPMHLWFVFPH